MNKIDEATKSMLHPAAIACSICPIIDYGYMLLNDKMWLLNEYDENEICLIVFFFLWIMCFAQLLLLLGCLQCIGSVYFAAAKGLVEKK